MERHVVSTPDSGERAATATSVPASISPRQAMEFFEFFKPGTQREVLLLGDLVEQRVHFVKSKNHKVLCGSAHAECELCRIADVSDNVSTYQVEYYAPAYVRPDGGGGSLIQQVVVFSAAAGEKVLRLVTEGSHRGHRLRIHRQSKQLIRITLIEGPPTGLSHVVPPPFDLLPFIRARFGKPQDPARPLVFLPPIRAKDLKSGPTHRPAALAIADEDVRIDAETLAKWRAHLDKSRAELAEEKTFVDPHAARLEAGDRRPEEEPAASQAAAPVVEQLVSGEPTPASGRPRPEGAEAGDRRPEEEVPAVEVGAGITSPSPSPAPEPIAASTRNEPEYQVPERLRAIMAEAGKHPPAGHAEPVAIGTSLDQVLTRTTRDRMAKPPLTPEQQAYAAETARLVAVKRGAPPTILPLPSRNGAAKPAKGGGR